MTRSVGLRAVQIEVLFVCLPMPPEPQGGLQKKLLRVLLSSTNHWSQLLTSAEGFGVRSVNLRSAAAQGVVLSTTVRLSKCLVMGGLVVKRTSSPAAWVFLRPLEPQLTRWATTPRSRIQFSNDFLHSMRRWFPFPNFSNRSLRCRKLLENCIIQPQWTTTSRQRSWVKTRSNLAATIFSSLRS